VRSECKRRRLLALTQEKEIGALAQEKEVVGAQAKEVVAALAQEKEVVGALAFASLGGALA
jgi:hypothetical protein